MSDRNLRVGDFERDDATARLSDHFAAGRLSRSEFDERTTQAFSARTRGELDDVMVDLPSTSADTGPLEMVVTANDTDVVQRSEAAQWRTSMLAPWMIFGVFFVILWAVTGGGYFWPMWPIMGWGIGVAVSGVRAHAGHRTLPPGPPSSGTETRPTPPRNDSET